MARTRYAGRMPRAPATVTHAPFVLRVEPQGWACPVPPGVTLWRAARRAGIRLPSSCLNGTCRTCLCHMSSGAVDYVVDWPGVSADERAEGWVLPCVARALSDVVLTVPGAVLAESADAGPQT